MLPSWFLLVALVITAFAVAVFVSGLTHIIRYVRRGAPAPGRLSPTGARFGRLVSEVLGHSRFQNRPWVRIAHWFVMLSFPLLFVTLVTAYGQLQNPGWVMPILGHLAPWGWLTELMAWGGLAGGAYLTILRAVTGSFVRDGQLPRTSRFLGSNQAAARYVEFVIVAVLICIIILRGLEYAYFQGTDLGSTFYFPTTAWIGSLVAGVSASTLGWLITITALVKIAVSLSWLIVVGCFPNMGVAWHRFLAIVNVFARKNVDGSPALGPADNLMVGDEPLTVENLEELDEDASLGINTVSDISWKGLLDTATCTECGRCQELCPAWNSAKPLSPKTLVTSIRDHAMDTPFGKAASHHGDILGQLMDTEVVPEIISEETLWACTTCGACVDQCPVDIEHLDLIIGLRRHQVLMESAFPASLNKMFMNSENKGNPWGMNPRKRLDWAKNLDFEVPQIGVDVESASEVDYLFWVGCAGAFDDRAKKTSAAIAELLHTAGVTFAVLGEGESCTGDPARRAGNEVLFQMLAAQNIEILNEVEATKIVVSCAHCFNTIAKEYPSLGGTYEVVHHSQLLNRLVRDGRLTPVAPPENERRTITFHDPCYLGRHNKIYAPPRELLGEVKEMAWSKETSLCCGAGGAHAFMEDTSPIKINTLRAQQAADTGADVIATACPFCTTMLTDGSKAIGSDAEVKDLSILLLEGVRRGQAPATDNQPLNPSSDS